MNRRATAARTLRRTCTTFRWPPVRKQHANACHMTNNMNDRRQQGELQRIVTVLLLHIGIAPSAVARALRAEQGPSGSTGIGRAQPAPTGGTCVAERASKLAGIGLLTGNHQAEQARKEAAACQREAVGTSCSPLRRATRTAARAAPSSAGRRRPLWTISLLLRMCWFCARVERTSARAEPRLLCQPELLPTLQLCPPLLRRCSAAWLPLSQLIRYDGERAGSGAREGSRCDQA